MTTTTDAIIRQIEALGYAFSVHRIEPVWMARNIDVDGEIETYKVACALAELAGIKLDDG